MAFTDAEMAVLSQMSYADLNFKDMRADGTIRLEDFLTSPNCREVLEKKLHVQLKPDGSGFDDIDGKAGEYVKIVNGLLNKIKGQDYTIVKHVGTDNDHGTGLAAIAIKDPANCVTVACRGTEIAINDLETDEQIGFLERTDQQIRMEQFVAELEQDGYKGYYFTGHSLGGNNAAHGALRLSDPSKLLGVVTFNAPGFSEKYAKDNKLDQYPGFDKFVNYSNERDNIHLIYELPGKNVIVSNRNVGEDNPLMGRHNILDLSINPSTGEFQANESGQNIYSPMGWVFTLFSEAKDHPTITSLITSAFLPGILGIAAIIELAVVPYLYIRRHITAGSKGKNINYSAAEYSYHGQDFTITPRFFLEASSDGKLSRAGSAIEEAQTRISGALNTHYPSTNIAFTTDLGTMGMMHAAERNASNQLRHQIKTIANEMRQQDENLRQAQKLLGEISDTIRQAASYLYQTGQAFQDAEVNAIGGINSWSGDLTGVKYDPRTYDAQLPSYVEHGTAADQAKKKTSAATSRLANQATAQLGKDIFGALGKIMKLPVTIAEKGPAAVADATWSVMNGVVATGSDAAALALMGIGGLLSNKNMKEACYEEAQKLMEQDTMSDFFMNQITEGKEPEEYDLLDTFWLNMGRISKTGDTASDLYGVASSTDKLMKHTDELLSGDKPFLEYAVEQAGFSTDSDDKFSNPEEISKLLDTFFEEDEEGKTGIQRVTEKIMKENDFAKWNKKVTSIEEDMQEIADLI